jgi:RNA polymerase sigma-70 factor, ECF subfamily
MLATAKRFLRSEHDSADAVQDAFVSAFRSLASFEGNSRIGTWLHQIVIYSCLMKLRKKSRDRSVSIDELLPQFDHTGHRVETVRKCAECADAILEREDLRSLVRGCIDILPEPYRQILILRDIEEIDTDETASILGIRSGAVKTRLHRARQALRTLLEPVL